MILSDVSLLRGSRSALLLVLVCCAAALIPSPTHAQAGLNVIVIDGDEAANIVAGKIAAEPVIEVRDRDDRRVANAIVRFVIRKTARNRLAAAFRNGQAEVRTLTDATGRASANFLTRSNRAAPDRRGGQLSGQTGRATIRHTNYATTADAKAAGREPGKSTNSNAQTSPTGATTGAAAGAATAATTGTATTTATTAAVSAGGGVSKLAVIGLVAGGAVGPERQSWCHAGSPIPRPAPSVPSSRRRQVASWRPRGSPFRSRRPASTPRPWPIDGSSAMVRPPPSRRRPRLYRARYVHGRGDRQRPAAIGSLRTVGHRVFPQREVDVDRRDRFPRPHAVGARRHG